MYTYVQRPVCKKENTATYVHTGGVLNAYSRIRTARARVHGWVGTEKLRCCRVHGEPTGWVGTECVAMFIARAWTEQPMETRPSVLHNEGNDLVFDRPRSKRDPVHREGSGVPQNGGNGRLGRNNRWKRGLAYCTMKETTLCSTGHVRNGILFIGRGLAYRKTEETDLCWTSYSRNGVLLIGRGVAYRKTEETDLCWSATVETGVLFIRRGVAGPPTVETGSC